MQSANRKSDEKQQQKTDFSVHLSAFLNNGAVLQTGSDSYKLFIGPFTPATSSDCMQDLLYKPDFWDFTTDNNVSSNLLKAYNIVDLNKQQMINLTLSLSEGKENPVIEWQLANKVSFQKQFEWLHKKIKQNEICKGLPITHQIGSPFNAENKWKIIQNILQKKSDQYLYGFWNNSFGFIGFTPEILITSDKNKFQTMALAGTWSKQDLTPFDFKDLKIQNEHQIVVEDILKQLSDEKLILKSENEILELEYLYHLKTNFHYQSNNIEKCLQKLHPTAALGLYPRSNQLFEEFQKFDLQNCRENFGAPFGYLGPDKSFVIVAIRNIHWRNENISIFSGCGVTAESDFESEWSELDAKRNSVKNTFGLNL